MIFNFHHTGAILRYKISIVIDNASTFFWDIVGTVIIFLLHFVIITNWKNGSHLISPLFSVNVKFFCMIMIHVLSCCVQ